MYRNCLDRACTKIASIGHVLRVPRSGMPKVPDTACTKTAWISHVRTWPRTDRYPNSLDLASAETASIGPVPKLYPSAMYRECLDQACTDIARIGQASIVPRSGMYRARLYRAHMVIFDLFGGGVGSVVGRRRCLCWLPRFLFLRGKGNRIV